MIGAIVGHLVGDYLLQNDYLALNKKKNSAVCFVHCFIWTACVLLFGCPRNGGLWLTMIVALILLGTHFVQDRTTIVRKWMSFVGQDQFAGSPFGPWSIIVVDNVWHIVTIYTVWTTFDL